MNVFILASCPNKELFPYTKLVFDTIHIGFPTSTIKVFINKMEDRCKEDLKFLCEFHQEVDTIHHKWIEQLVLAETEPFWIVDTDIIFYGSIEQFDFSKEYLVGWRIPEFRDEFSGCITRSRLHTSLLYIDPSKVKLLLQEYTKNVVKSVFTPIVNPFYPLCVPFKGQMYFYDTCSMLYHFIKGKEFTPQQKDVYCHMNFGTISDLVLPRLKNGNELKEIRKQILTNTSLGISQWRKQEEYYAERRV